MRRLVVILMLVAGGASAEPTREAVKAGVARCDGISDNRAWLNCFYGAAQPMRALLGLSPAPQSAPAQAAAPLPVPQAAPAPQVAVRPTPPHKPGFFGDMFGPGIKLVTGLHVTDITFNKDGTFVLTLEDGQVWKQNAPPEHHAQLDKPPASYVVDVTEGVLGSDDLRIRGVRQAYKAHRLR